MQSGKSSRLDYEKYFRIDSSQTNLVFLVFLMLAPKQDNRDNEFVRIANQINFACIVDLWNIQSN